MTSYTKPLTSYAKPYILIMTSYADKHTNILIMTSYVDKHTNRTNRQTYNLFIYIYILYIYIILTTKFRFLEFQLLVSRVGPYKEFVTTNCLENLKI